MPRAPTGQTEPDRNSFFPRASGPWLGSPARGPRGPGARIEVSWDNEPFSGFQGSYCWRGIATTVQTASTSALTCYAAALPDTSAGLPTIAVYPNATLSFQFPDQQYPQSLTASLYRSGSMQPVQSNVSAASELALGLLPAGGYILSVHAKYGQSFTFEYFGIQ